MGDQLTGAPANPDPRSRGKETLLPREFFGRPSLEVAPALLGCVLECDSVAGLVAVRVTEVEAYSGATDPASHAYRRKSGRNQVMFGPPGFAYVYQIYGLHFCVNLVCQPAGTAEAVLLRAGQVVAGTEVAWSRRPAARTEDHLARGPALLCQVLAIDRRFDGTDVCVADSPVRILGPRPGDAPAAGVIRAGPRVGVTQAAGYPWRFWIDGDRTVSAYRKAVPRKRPGTQTVTTPGREGGSIQP
ncbi:MAG TPA: DNA-3-methyladenine glycosylase [Streptosporangiaceae bacterium]|nr:DNA-3-methyladenine glycosylase [Streptosporangiaceae bacterium]